MIELKTLIFSCVISGLAGFIGGYYIKDNVSEPDEQTNIDVDLTVKKNKLFNSKTKVKRKLFNFGQKKKIRNNDNSN